MVIVHGVGIHNDPAPGWSAIRLGRETTHAVRQAIDDCLGQLTALIDPSAGQFKRQQLAHILWIIQGHEDYFAVNAGGAVSGR